MRWHTPARSCVRLARRPVWRGRHAPPTMGLADRHPAPAPGKGYIFPMTLTPARQRNAVSGGMALGLILNKRASLPHNKAALDLSFEGTWESWPYRSKFPQVARDLANGTDGIVAMTRADKDKH